MRLVATRRLDIGTRIGRDVLTGRADGTPLLRAGVQVTPRYKEALLAAGINGVYVDDELGEGIDVQPVVREKTRREPTVSLDRASKRAPGGAAEGKPIPRETIEDLTRIAALIAQDV